MSISSPPQPATTVALIFGASRWPDCPKFQDAPSLDRSADAFIQFIRSEQGLGIPFRNIKSLFNSYDDPAEQLDQAQAFVMRCRQQGEEQDRPISDLIIYYAGHGDFEGEGRDFYLTIRRAHKDHPLLTNITARSFGNWMRQTARDLRAYLIIDCCFAAALQHGFLSSPLGLAELRLNEALPAPAVFDTDDEVPTSGVALLAASGLNDPALAPSNEPYTRFTAALLDVLREGNERFPPVLSLSDLHQLIDRRINQKFPDGARPELRSLRQTRGRVELVRLFRNPAALRVEERRKIEEAARLAEEERKTDEAARLAAEEKRRAYEAARLAEEKRRDDEAARLAEERRQTDEAARLAAEEKRRADEAARLAEEKRRNEEAARLAEEKRQADEAARLAEKKRRADEAARLAEEKRQADEAARLAEKKRRADEAARLAEEKRKTDEGARLAEEQYTAREADREIERRESDEAITRSDGVDNFDRLVNWFNEPNGGTAKRKAETAVRLAGGKRKADQAAKLAEEKRRTDDVARLAEEERKAEKAAGLAEGKRKTKNAKGLLIVIFAGGLTLFGVNYFATKSTSIISTHGLLSNSAPEPGLYTTTQLPSGAHLTSGTFFMSVPGKVRGDAPGQFEEIKGMACTVASIKPGHRIEWSDIGDCP